MSLFIRQLDDGTWYNKSGITQGLIIDESYVTADVWYAMYIYNNQAYIDMRVMYDDETIVFAVKKGWDTQ